MCTHSPRAGAARQMAASGAPRMATKPILAVRFLELTGVQNGHFRRCCSERWWTVLLFLADLPPQARQRKKRGKPQPRVPERRPPTHAGCHPPRRTSAGEFSCRNIPTPCKFAHVRCTMMATLESSSIGIHVPKPPLVQAPVQLSSDRGRAFRYQRLRP